jgi:chemotaxis protein CheD
MTSVVNREQSVVISLGELHVTKDPDTLLVCYGIGSCIAFAAFDPMTKIAGMAHFVLPDSKSTSRPKTLERFVDAGIPVMLDQMQAVGAVRSRTIFKIAGGAHMAVAKGFESRLNIGERNIEAARETMKSLGLRLRGEDVGGTHGRTVRLFAGTGALTISTVGGSSYEL